MTQLTAITSGRLSLYCANISRKFPIFENCRGNYISVNNETFTYLHADISPLASLDLQKLLKANDPDFYRYLQIDRTEKSQYYKNFVLRQIATISLEVKTFVFLVNSERTEMQLFFKFWRT